MGLYSRVVFPALCDLAMRAPELERRRRELLAGAEGRVLEIGIGTGLNLRCYPAGVRRVTAVEPNPGMRRRLERRAEASGVALELHAVRGEALPFESGAFDVAVATWTLCSVRDPDGVLAELFRVLRPGGRMLFLEHGASPDPKVRRWQRRLAPVQRRIADGCRLDQDVGELLARSPFGGYEGAAGYLDGVPRLLGFTVGGVAVR
jgi:ubiquinone/menaquinone biosynthesis C-methylase UbiE